MVDPAVSEDTRVAVLEREVALHVSALKERMDLRFQSAKEALEIQTGEIARRLGELNGEAGRLREMQVKYVPREVHDSKIGELEKMIRSLENWQANMLGRMAMIGGGVGIVTAVITALIKDWMSK
jgi:hypothetical protein